MLGLLVNISITVAIVMAINKLFFQKETSDDMPVQVKETESAAPKMFKRGLYWVVIYLLIINSTGVLQAIFGQLFKQFGQNIFYLSRIAALMFIYVISLQLLRRKHTIAISYKSMSIIYLVASAILAVDYLFNINNLEITSSHNGASYIIISLSSAILYLKSSRHNLDSKNGDVSNANS